MPSESDLAAIQRMHETKLVNRDALIGWYRWYQRQLPPLRPEQSNRDLLLTLATWMDLTEKGGRPAFPYDYRTDLDFSQVALDIADRPGLGWPIGAFILVVGLVLLFFRPWVGVGLVVLGVALQWILYKSRGGASSVAMKDPAVRREVDRALRWVHEHSN